MSFPMDPGGLGGLGGMFSGMQQRMEQMKAEAAQTEVEGSAGGGLVTVVANGGMEVVRVRISPDAADDTEMLEDLIVAATNDAMRKAKDVLGQKMSSLMGGMPLPPGLMGF